MRISKKLLSVLLAVAMTVCLLPAATLGAAAASTGLEFESKGDGTCAVVDIGTCTDTELVIPAVSPAGDAVTAIGFYAFDGCDSLTSVTIPNGVTTIEDSAFFNCGYLTSVTIPSSVTSIGEGAFQGCRSLTSIEVSAGNPSYAVADGILFSKDKTELVRFPAGRSGAFTVPSDVTSIAVGAFSNCDITSVTIPDTVTDIGAGAFSECSGLTSINVTANNPSYSSADGVFFNKDMTTLILCPAGKTGDYAVPSGVTKIGFSAFDSCSGLTAITLPNTVTSLGGGAFYGCSSLTSLVIPEKVTGIDWFTFCECTSLTSLTIPVGMAFFSSMAIDDCDSLTDVYFTGTKAQWNEVFFENPADGRRLTAIAHCTDGDATDDIEKNLALEGTPIDMNTGLTEDDDGYVPYDTFYEPGPQGAFDGDRNYGWVIGLDESGNGVDEAEVRAHPEQYPADEWYTPDDIYYYPMTRYDYDNVWIGVRFNKPTACGRVELYWDSTSIYPLEEGGYKVEYSLDGTTWNALDAVASRTVEESKHIDVVTFDPMSVLALRVVVLKGTSKWAPRLYEFEVYENAPVTPGDLTGDGAVDASDLTAHARHVGGIVTLTGVALAAADFDGNGTVDASDLTALARKVGGIA